jgi:hypothetical protein
LREAREQPLLEGALAALRRVQVLPGRILDRHVEEGKERGQQRLEGPVQAQRTLSRISR